jgi:hypothetical protein
VLDSADWLCLFDHIFAWHQHSFVLVLAACAFILTQRSKLMKMKNIAQLESWVHENHCGDVTSIVNMMHQLRQDHATRSLLVKLSGELPDDTEDDASHTTEELPQLRGYPEFALDFQQQERDRLAQEESAAKKKNAMIEEMNKRMKDIEAEEKVWLESQRMSAEMESSRLQQIRLAHDRALESSVNLHATNQQIRLGHVLDQEISTQAAIDRSNKLREQLMKRNEEELSWAQQRAQTLSSMKHEEASINNQVARVLSRIKQVEDKMKAEDETRASHAEVLLYFPIICEHIFFQDVPQFTFKPLGNAAASVTA